MTAALEQPTGLALWRRQAGAVLALELRGLLGTRRALPLAALAALPVAVMVASGAIADHHLSLGAAKAAFGGVFGRLILGACVFFGCALVFTQLFRGEILRRSLHFALLSPVRREVLVLAKYAAGLLATWLAFGVATVFSYLLLYLPFGGAWLLDDFAAGQGFAHLLTYLGKVLLACAGYGALFLLFGTAFRNPVLPVAALLAWELAHFLLPAALQAASIRRHLNALPSPMPTPVLDALTAPAAAWSALTTLLAIIALALALAAWRLRRLELRYDE